MLFFFYFVFQCCFWFVFLLYILMTYFDCFELVGSLEFHVYADKMSNKQYFLGDMTRLQVSLLNKYFPAQTTSHKNSVTTI